MTAVPGGKSDQGAPRLRSQRRLLLIGGTAYLAWWFVVQALLPNAYNAALGRSIVVGLFFAALAASFTSRTVARRLDIVFIACAWLLTAHYYYLFYRNHGEMPWAVGAYVVVFAVAACLPSGRALLAYSLATVVLGLAVAM